METNEKMSPPSFAGRLVGIIMDPVQTLASLREHPAWLWVLLLTIVIRAAANLVIGPVESKETSEYFTHSKWYEMIPEAKRAEVLDQMQHPSTGKKVQGLVGTVVGWGLYCAAFAGILWIAQRVLGGSGSYKSLMSVAAYSLFVGLGLGTLVVVPLILSKGSIFEVSLGPAAFFDTEVGSSSYRLLHMLELFPLWGAVIAGLGVAAVSRISKALGLIISFSFYAVVSGVIYVMGGLFFAK